jgi:hypothetical protein
MATKEIKISNPEHTGTKNPSTGTLPRTEKHEQTRGKGRQKTRLGPDPAVRTDEEK